MCPEGDTIHPRWGAFCFQLYARRHTAREALGDKGDRLTDRPSDHAWVGREGWKWLGELESVGGYGMADLDGTGSCGFLGKVEV